jgi:HD-GYP domain-containing protein (c-di-GMP phosphodiesterase class II)
MPSLSNRSAISSDQTLQRISTSQLRPGMFLVRVLDSWWKSPFFTHRRLLNSVTEIEQLMYSGIREVEIDISLGVGVASTEDSGLEECLPAESDTSAVSVNHDDSTMTSPPTVMLEPSHETESNAEDMRIREEVVQVREAVMAAVEDAFEGVKTGQEISHPEVHQSAQALVQQCLAHPGLIAEIMLIDSLKQFDKTLYAHVVDTSVYSILVGLQLGWDEGSLETIGLAGLLHDVGYMRLPKNVVAVHWDRGGEARLLQQHVAIGEKLLQRHAQFSSDIVRIVSEHHAYQDGSGYPEGLGGAWLSESGKLLGLVDAFDELMTIGGTSGALPAAFAIRRLYQEAQQGKFSTGCIEGLIRTLGVFPIGTVVQLSTGEQAVVVKQHSDGGVKPLVKIFRAGTGKDVDVPYLCNLANDANLGHDRSIVRVLDPTEYSLNLQEFF